MQDFASSQIAFTNSALITHRFIRAIRWARLIWHICICLLMVGIVFPRVSVRQRAYLTQWWSKKTLRILNVVLSIHGARLDVNVRNAIIASNHISWLDVYVINAAHPVRFVAKAEIQGWPIIGWLSEKAGTIFIRRTHRRDTARINDEMHQVLTTGATIGLFLEGTTTAGDRLLKFHSSLLEPAITNHAMLVPTALRYLTRDGERCFAVAYTGDISFADSMKAIIGQQTMIAEITFAPPIPAADSTRRDLALHAETVVAAILNVPIPDAHQRFSQNIDAGAKADVDVELPI